MSDATAAEFDRLLDQYSSVGQELTPLARRMAFETVAGALPSTHTIRVHGSLNEGWLRVLRIRQVLDVDGGVLFDVDEGHDDEAVEQAIDFAGTEYLDLLLDLTGDEYLGPHELAGEIRARSRRRWRDDVEPAVPSRTGTWLQVAAGSRTCTTATVNEAGSSNAADIETEHDAGLVARSGRLSSNPTCVC